MLKGGETVDELRVGRQACYVLGRNEDVCDFGMQHPSISRQHAAVVHDKQGLVNVLDLGSAQGTFVNGKEIKPNEPHVLNGTPWRCSVQALAFMWTNGRSRRWW